MELDAMISEICRKVQERVAELEKEEASAEPAAVPSEDNRPALLCWKAKNLQNATG